MTAALSPTLPATATPIAKRVLAGKADIALYDIRTYRAAWFQICGQTYAIEWLADRVLLVKFGRGQERLAEIKIADDLSRPMRTVKIGIVLAASLSGDADLARESAPSPNEIRYGRTF